MSAIKLPVEALPGELFWSVRDARGVEISVQQPESVANQIALALNMYDELVAALKFYSRTPRELRNRVRSDLPGTMNDWNIEICNDGGDIARAALEKLNQTKP